VCEDATFLKPRLLIFYIKRDLNSSISVLLCEQTIFFTDFLIEFRLETHLILQCVAVHSE